MADDKPTDIEENKAPDAVELESGTYEIIRNRLLKSGDDLSDRLTKLNAARKEVFGSVETTLIATERITTENNCIPVDMVPFGSDLFLFGYNVHIGLKTETLVADVFSVYQYDPEGHQFQQQGLEVLNDKTFAEDFSNLYKYYRNTTFVKFAEIGNYIFMVFQIGKAVSDIKTFKWLSDGKTLKYIDNRSDHEFKFPDQHEFTWKRTRREMYREGANPHISIEDKVFVETIGGDLTIKIEDNTDSGKGIYSEPVDHKDQTLDDGDISYAVIGNLVVLKIRPYQENDYRYILYNEKIKEAIRVDALEHSCVLLPDDHGLIFPKGYYLHTGESKFFDSIPQGLLFERRISSPNGEDFLYVFYNPNSGTYNLMSYNLITQQVDSPILCNGYSLFKDGELSYFKAEEEQQKHHTIQIWQTPYTDPNVTTEVENDSYLYKVGNKDIVRAMAESGELIKLINKEDSYANLYIDIVKRATDIIDSYYWLDKDESYHLADPVRSIRDSAASAVDEFDKVVRIRKNTAEEVKRVTDKADELLTQVKGRTPDDIDLYVELLARLRESRGEVISLKDLRYVDLEMVDSWEEQLTENNARLSQSCVEFLLQDDALKPYEKKVEDLRGGIEELQKVVDANAMEEEIMKVSKELEMLIEIVTNLKIEDATHTTRIIDNISAIYSNFNQINASLKKRRKELLGVEGKAEFNAQLKLVSQGVINYLDVCDTPEKTDEYLTRLMVQLEELEGKFSEFDEFVSQIIEKREEIYNAFESRKLQLIEERNRRAGNMLQSAERILNGIGNRLGGMKTVAEINGYFASDLMVDKVRDLIQQLIDLGDTVKADDIQSRLKTAREDAVRQLKDKTELFEEGEDVIRLGKHRFMVNTRPLDLTLVMRNGEMCYHLTGTNFFEPVNNEDFAKTEPVWNQSLVSENENVYRSEYLAYRILTEVTSHGSDESKTAATLESLLKKTDEELLEFIRQYMAPRYNEGYTKGVHDEDAMQILKALLHLYQSTGLLRFSASARALAALYWHFFEDAGRKEMLDHRMKGAGVLLQVFPETRAFDDVVAELLDELNEFNAAKNLFEEGTTDTAAWYLFNEISRGNQFVISGEATHLYEGFNAFLKKNNQAKAFSQSLKKIESDRAAQYRLTRKWLTAWVEAHPKGNDAEFIDEAAFLLLLPSIDKSHVTSVPLSVQVGALHGTHKVTEDGYQMNYVQFMERLRHFDTHVAPLFEQYTELKKEMIDAFRDELRLEEFKPRVLSSFVRNKLIDEVYLPLIGSNLAKQIGTAGETKRTDLMGMLLLISPPGYGKTTLMEYMASRLGLVFMKINGPAIGHSVTSIDPAEATNASAREELEKLNLALEMGDNIMLYLDDIQHCHPEFLQKFISLCDAQRKIEGVYKGKTKTYDLRGRKVAVVMAGNPYTESGDKFQIPDMLANRADIYNLGDIIGDSAEAFKLSYVENSLTSNSGLARLMQKSQKDVYALIRLAEGGDREGVEFEANHSAEEINEYVSLLQKSLAVRNVLLKVNSEYIYSAAQAEEYREEPPFKLQGSYRNMNKIVEKLNPIMNAHELQTLILSHYENESQTMTTGAEANMLKFRELYGALDADLKSRWDDIKSTFQRNLRMKGLGGNQMGHILSQMELLNQSLQGIGNALKRPEQEDTAPEPEKPAEETGEDEA